MIHTKRTLQATAAVFGMMHAALAHAAVVVELPEPGVLGLAAAGLIGVAWARRRKK
jgi:hypothetical protein